MDELQKQETRNKKNKDVYDKLKGDLRMIKEQLQAMQRALEPKVGICTDPFLTIHRYALKLFVLFICRNAR